jgi:16S rRNA (adenine1518-N6/adenine1519-N6)-dimethyltransferase
MAPRAKRRLGQHFLTDPRLLGRIADALGAGPGDTVLEIGPGLGGLTAALAARAARLVVIEKDAELVPALRERFPGVTVVEGDALELDWRGLAGGPFLAAGNIPYNITSPLIDKALEPPRPERIVFLVQKEVAERVTAGAGAPAYGAWGCSRWPAWSGSSPCPRERFSRGPRWTRPCCGSCRSRRRW